MVRVLPSPPGRAGVAAILQRAVQARGPRSVVERRVPGTRRGAAPGRSWRTRRSL